MRGVEERGRERKVRYKYDESIKSGESGEIIGFKWYMTLGSRQDS